MFKIKLRHIPIFTAIALMLLQYSPVKADVFLYTDPDYDFVFSVPDTWTRQTAVASLTQARFVAPVPADHAYCEVSANKDARFTIYPEHLMGKVMQENFDSAFWEAEISNRFINPALTKTRIIAGLDKAAATMAQLEYDLILEENKAPVRMYATMLVSVYGDTRYTMTCGAKHDSYHVWGDLFGSVFSSMTLANRYHVVPTGYYRNFLADKKHPIPHARLGDIMK